MKQIINNIPACALKIIKTLKNSGESAYIVGGCIRDSFLNKTNLDWDIATSAIPEKVMKSFPKVIPTGINHGTVTVLMDEDKFEVTTFRLEDKYSDGRHPDQVSYTDDIINDLKRRDFTINAMALDPIDNSFHDPFGGQKDIKKRLIKAVGNPDHRFSEDGLRILRAIRFVSALDFELEDNTFRAMKRNSPMLKNVSAERKRDELKKMLAGIKPSKGFSLMLQGNFQKHLFPDNFYSQNKSIFVHAPKRLDNILSDTKLRLAGLLMDVPIDDSGEPVVTWLSDMCIDKKTSAYLLPILKNLASPRTTSIDIRKLLSRTGFKIAFHITKLWKADCIAKRGLHSELAEIDNAVNLLKEEKISKNPIFKRDLKLNGNMLMNELKIAPGPVIGQLLDKLHEHILNSPEDNEYKKLINLARQFKNTLIS